MNIPYLKSGLLCIALMASSASFAVSPTAQQNSAADCSKGEGLPRGFLYCEVNKTNPLNALAFRLENGKLLWDVVVLFAANINCGNDGKPYVHCNPNVQFLLDNSETYLQPLRKRGIKVLLGLLGNHDAAGLAQLSDQGTRDFAKEVASYCEKYGLDGVNYDDEYSKAPDLDNPALTGRSYAAAARLCYETKKAMPDKLVTVFVYGMMYHGSASSVDGVDADRWIDIAVANYGATASPIGGMTKMKCSGVSMEYDLRIGGNLDETTAKSLIDNGYGWFMGFASDPPHFRQEVERLQGCKTLYGSQIAIPEVFYKKNDPARYAYPGDL